MVKELLNWNANIETKNYNKDTPLILGTFFKEQINFMLFSFFKTQKASQNGHLEVVKELLKHNANIEAKNDDGVTPLILGLFVN